MVMCSACGCSNRTDRNQRKPGVSFHKFPREKALREQWVKAVRRLNWEPGVNSYLCSEHFKTEFLNRTFVSGRTELRENAVPTIFSNYPSHLHPPNKKICKIPLSYTAEPISTTSAEPSIPQHLEGTIEELIEISKPSFKEIAVPRTVSQLKKLRGNKKFRRKVELAEAKRQTLRIGDGPFTPTSYEEDPELDALGGVDIEMKHIMDSKSLGTESYSITPEGGELTTILEPEINIKEVEEEVNQNKLTTSTEEKPKETGLKKKSYGFTSERAKMEINDLIKKEAELRVARVVEQRLYDKELHDIRIEEARVKLQMAEAELDILKLRKELLLKELKKN